MVCLYCGHDTRVTNSRPQKRHLRVWRRRACSNCGAIFTTTETIDLSASMVVRHLKQPVQPFNRDRLFLSILKVMGHRENALQDAGAIVSTIIAKLLHQATTAALEPVEIAQITHQTLHNFDSVAAVQYRAYHKDKI